MRVVFRADASDKIGIGHVMRCLTLAKRLRARGADTSFICREHTGHVASLLREAGMRVALLPSAAGVPKDGQEDYSRWLGVSQETDAAQTIEQLRETPGWLVVDHYGLDATWERCLRPHTGKLLVIDDLANRDHDCDLLLDQNFSQDPQNRYARRVPEHCKLLLGPACALLAPEYASVRASSQFKSRDVATVFIFFGGSDPKNATGLALETLSQPRWRHLQIHVVVGVNNPHRVQIEEQVRNRPGTFLYGARHHLADLMGAADLGIGAGGVTTWERMCVGLPSLIISIAENQRSACEALSRAGAVRYLGDIAQVDTVVLARAMEEYEQAPAQLSRDSIRGRLLVDGLGAQRTGECMMPTSRETLTLRPAHSADAELFHVWVNDPEVRRQSVRSEPISWSDHQRWFTTKLADPSARLSVLEANGLPVGQIRFDRRGTQVSIDYSIDPLFRGRGWAKQLIALGVRALASDDSEVIVVRAEVKDENLPSKAVFRSLQFVEAADSDERGLRIFTLELAASRKRGGILTCAS